MHEVTRECHERLVDGGERGVVRVGGGDGEKRRKEAWDGEKGGGRGGGGAEGRGKGGVERGGDRGGVEGGQ